MGAPISIRAYVALRTCSGEDGRPTGEPRRHDRAARDETLRRKINICRYEWAVQGEASYLEDRHSRGGSSKGTDPHALVIGGMAALPRYAGMPRHIHAAHIHAGHVVCHGQGHGPMPGAKDEATVAGHEARRNQEATTERDQQQCCQPRLTSPSDCDLVTHNVSLAEVARGNHGDFYVEQAVICSQIVGAFGCMQRTLPPEAIDTRLTKRRQSADMASYCHFCPHLRAYGPTANRGNIKRDALVTPTQLSPALIST